MQPIEKPGTANVGEFAPINTPLETPEVVTTAHTQATLHRQAPVDTAPKGSMTATHNAPVRITRK